MFTAWREFKGKRQDDAPLFETKWADIAELLGNSLAEYHKGFEIVVNQDEQIMWRFVWADNQQPGIRQSTYNPTTGRPYAR